MRIDESSELNAYLRPVDPRFNWVQARIASLLESHHAPSLSVSSLKLLDLVRSENTQIEDLEQIIGLDAGLASRCIKAASSAFYGGRPISTINDALMMIGFVEIRRIAFAVGVVDSFSRLKIKVDWKKFWLHSLLVGRLTQTVASAFKEGTGAEYLAGLLHDMGKLVIEHDFPREFEMVYLRSLERKCGHAEMERELLGIDHAQVGAAMCHVMKVSANVRHAVQHHHGIFGRTSSLRQLPDRGFLAACVSVGDSLAVMGGVSTTGVQVDHHWQELPAWTFLLAHFDPQFGLDLDLEAEVTRAEADLNSLSLQTA